MGRARDTAGATLGFVRQRLVDALPTIVVYMVLFASVVALFGLQYTMVVSCATSLFRSHGSREATGRTYLAIVTTCLVLCLLAWIASLELGLCVLLNATVPFLLVMATSNQFTPKGYFGYAMTFAFLQLKPLTLPEFAVQLAAVAWSSVVVVASVAAWRAWATRGADPGDDVREGLGRLASILERLAAGEGTEALADELVGLERSFDRLRLARHHLLRGERGREVAYGLYALLFQRAIYLLEDSGWQGGDAARPDPEPLRALAVVVRRASGATTVAEREALVAACRLLLDSAELPEGRLRVFFRSFLHLMIAILRRDAASVALPETGLAGAVATPRRVVMGGAEPWRHAARELTSRMTRDSFEFRFALRLSVVLVTSCTLSMAWGVEHAYWLPLNAFLMLMPSYEESRHRMWTRPLGTLLGCAITYAVTVALPGGGWVFVVSLALISVMYCCAPGGWVQASFATAFALLMASLSLNATTAMWLRCVFVALAVALVLAVNRLVVPSRARTVYEANRRQLLRIMRSYWATIARSLDEGPSGLGRAGELLGDFHLHYKEAADFAAGLPGPEREAEMRSLTALWHLFSEVEQVEYLVQEGLYDARDARALSAVALVLGERPGPTSSLDVLEALVGGLSSGDLAFVLRRYLEGARRWGEEAMRPADGAAG